MTERVVVITGASAGIGEALAELLSAEGHQLVLLARREQRLKELAARLPAPSLPLTTDVTLRSQVQQAVTRAVEHFGHIDVWVNNAGRGISLPVAELTDEDFDEMMLVNVKSVLYCMQSVLPHFKQRARGHIINVSSMLGRVPFAPIRSAYSAAKHAMNSLSANLRMDLRESFPEIHVSCVHPGVVATEFGVNARHGGLDSRKFPTAQSREEVAQVIRTVIETPRADVYTRPEGQKMVVGYFAAEDMAEAERNFGFRPPPTQQKN